MKRKSNPTKVMYGALLQISCLSTMHFFNDAETLLRAKEIADKALQEMNVSHTNLVRKALFGGGT